MKRNSPYTPPESDVRYFYDTRDLSGLSGWLGVFRVEIWFSLAAQIMILTVTGWALIDLAFFREPPYNLPLMSFQAIVTIVYVILTGVTLWFVVMLLRELSRRSKQFKTWFYRLLVVSGLKYLVAVAMFMPVVPRFTLTGWLLSTALFFLAYIPLLVLIVEWVYLLRSRRVQLTLT